MAFKIRYKKIWETSNKKRGCESWSQPLGSSWLRDQDSNLD